MRRQETLTKKLSKQTLLSKGSILESVDAFGTPLPTFNIKGRQAVHTRFGGFCTLIISTIIMLYASVKFIHLQTRHNPRLSMYYSNVPPDFSVSLNEKNMRFAFAIEDFLVPKQLKNDPDYVKWVVRLFGRKDGKYFQKQLPYHICTEEDYADFYPIDSHLFSLNIISAIGL